MCYLAAEDLFPNHIRTYSQADYVFVTRTAQRYRSLAQGYLTTLFKKNNNNGTGDVHATQCAPVESSCILRHFDLILVTYCSIAQIWLHYLHWVPQICKKQNIRCYLSLHLQPPRSYSAQIKCDHENELKMLFWGGRVWNKVIWNQRDYALIEHNFTAEHR